MIWAEVGVLLMFFMGYFIGRHTRNNDIQLPRSVDSAIAWISANGRGPEEQKVLVDFLIWLEDGEDMQED